MIWVASACIINLGMSTLVPTLHEPGWLANLSGRRHARQEGGRWTAACPQARPRSTRRSPMTCGTRSATASTGRVRCCLPATRSPPATGSRRSPPAMPWRCSARRVTPGPSAAAGTSSAASAPASPCPASCTPPAAGGLRLDPALLEMQDLEVYQETAPDNIALPLESGADLGLGPPRRVRQRGGPSGHPDPRQLAGRPG